MRPTLPQGFEKYRRLHPLMGASPHGSLFGYFALNKLQIISSGAGTGTDPNAVEAWEHVSVSSKNRCPTWHEMKMIKDVFWLPDEMVLQFHPPESVYVNQVATCLHLWKSPSAIILPPLECV
jgi:hypothetical protein